jgi:hypothetical protein
LFLDLQIIVFLFIELSDEQQVPIRCYCHVCNLSTRLQPALRLIQHFYFVTTSSIVHSEYEHARTRDNGSTICFGISVGSLANTSVPDIDEREEMPIRSHVDIAIK